MTEAVTDVIVARARATERLQPMVAWSVGVHIVLLLLVLIVPMFHEPGPPAARMTIMLSAGAPGEVTGGLTPIGGRPIQQVAPSEAPRIVEAPPPPPPEAPKMVLPDPKPVPRPETRKPVIEKPPPPKPAATPAPTARPAPTAKPSTGEEVREGTARVETRSRGTGFGLSSGGGGASGSAELLDVTDFCCPEYVTRMATQIRLNWDQQTAPGRLTVIRFTIRRDGTIEDARVDRPSGVPALDRAAHRAVLITKQLPRLPEEFSNPTLTVRLTFEY